MVLPLPMRMGSLDVFIESTRGRIRHGDAKLILIDDLLADFYTAVDGDPPLAPHEGGHARRRQCAEPAMGLEIPSGRSGTARHPAVHAAVRPANRRA